MFYFNFYCFIMPFVRFENGIKNMIENKADGDQALTAEQKSIII